MIARYTRPALKKIWSEENRFRQWLLVELAACDVLSEMGVTPPEAARLLRQHADFNVDRINEIEKEVRHDVIAFTTSVAESMAAAGHAEHSRWFHYGLTSNDIVDTAQSMLIQLSSVEIRKGIDALLDALKQRALEHQNTLQIGRTHGVHAEPVTFGLKLARFYDELRRNARRFDAAVEDIRIGKLSGAVGAFAHITPETEERICERLGLRPAAIASQVLSRDLHAAWLSALALVCATCESIALEVRHLQRTEVREAEEPFGAGQKGSSAMPHKRNPVVCEQICGLARVARSNVQAAFENIALWHERDISHSSVERVILADTSILADYLLAKSQWLVSGLRVNADRMTRNFHATKGLVFSGQLLLDLTEAGMLREQAYRLVQSTAMRCWEEESDFRAAVLANPEVSALLSPEKLEKTFGTERQLAYIGDIFRRVFA
jgi:adenylosuccinate lyase